MCHPPICPHLECSRRGAAKSMIGNGSGVGVGPLGINTWSVEVTAAVSLG